MFGCVPVYSAGCVEKQQARQLKQYQTEKFVGIYKIKMIVYGLFNGCSFICNSRLKSMSQFYADICSYKESLKHKQLNSINKLKQNEEDVQIKFCLQNGERKNQNFNLGIPIFFLLFPCSLYTKPPQLAIAILRRFLFTSRTAEAKTANRDKQIGTKGAVVQD